MEPQLTQLTVIVGPTASGKTGLGIKKAQAVNGAVVSADSRQIYAGFNIGTATPLRLSGSAGQEPHDILTPDMVDGVPHYFLNTHSPLEKISLSQWQQEAFSVIDNLLAKNIPVFLVGGTMLYVDSIIFNYDIPNIPPNDVLRNKLTEETASDLYKKLQSQDPEATKFIEPHNKARITRALEVMSATGRPFSEQRKKRSKKYNYEITGIFPGWDELKTNITTRIHAMWQDGLENETKTLINRYGADLPLLQTMNYLQTIKYLNGEYSQEKATEEMIRANFRYARRQMSWWKNRHDIKWVT